METELEKPTKINAAIQDTKLRLINVKEQIMFLIRERDVLQRQLETLEIIEDNKELI
jgi:hypothetical protein